MKARSGVNAKKKHARRTTLSPIERKQERATMNLYKTTQAWLRAHGGDMVVGGGVGIMGAIEPPTSPYRFSVVVRVLGKRPQKVNVE